MGNSRKRKIILEDGDVYTGKAFGWEEEVTAEMVFNTSMTGYQEILSDPSYTDQAVVMTYPLIGNYGICEDDYETKVPSLSALVVREYCEAPSNFRCIGTLDETLKRFRIAGISGIDTRKLARHIRDIGSMKAAIVSEDADEEAVLQALRQTKLPTDAVSRVSTDAPLRIEAADQKFHIAAIDCGMKKSIPENFAARGCSVTVVPWNTPASEILGLSPDGVFLSNGPGDPENVPEAIRTASGLIGKLPVFGICLGHQIISLAYGAKTYKLKFGHRGGNHPVKDLRTGKIAITSQNHSYAVDADSLAGTGLEITHRNLLDQTVEGVRCVKDRVFSVQYHPESAPGPLDCTGLFDEFLELMKH